MTNRPYPTSRVNARIDRVAEEQLRYVTEHTQMNVTEALKASIALMYDKVRREEVRAFDVLSRSGFIGMGDSGSDNGSTDYKTIIAASIAHKHGLNADR
jgi:uncharacterized protein YbbK (DUF523 family)